MNTVVNEQLFSSGQKLQLVHGDITDESVDAIVNAANAHLAHGAGVAGAIVRKGGWQIQVESDQWVQKHGMVSHTEPAYTHAGNLPCRYVIHAVGPIWSEGQEEEKLEAAIRGSLQLAGHLGVQSISFPAISTGIYRFPKQLAAQIILSTIQSFLAADQNTSLRLVRIVIYDPEILQAFVDTWEQDDHLHS
jgi:O-acetyl-ADP-ribose deacetylase (regulator of RNase III)